MQPLGAEMERGDLPSDRDLIGGMVRNICFGNARQYFGFPVDGVPKPTGADGSTTAFKRAYKGSKS